MQGATQGLFGGSAWVFDGDWYGIVMRKTSKPTNWLLLRVLLRFIDNTRTRNCEACLGIIIASYFTVFVDLIQFLGPSWEPPGGFFLMRCSGRGSVAFGCTGSCIKYDLQAGECRAVDNGHLVAWADTVSYTVGMASSSLFGTMASGEGLMCSFTGPGPVWIQTHKSSSASTQQGSKMKQQQGASNIIGACIVFFIFIIFFLMLIVAVVFGSQSEIPERRSHRRQYLSDEF